MNPFRRILVALDLSKMDAQLLAYVAGMHARWGAEKIYFLHILRDFVVPDNLNKDFKSLFAAQVPVDEKIQAKIVQDVQQHFADAPRLELSVEVITGKPHEQLLRWTELKEVDLLVVGHKQVSEGSGINARRVARQAACHLLFVAENAPTVPEHILVPIDFSEHAAHALQVALGWQRRFPESRLTALNVVDMPPGEYYQPTSHGIQMRTALLDAAKDAWEKMMTQYALDKATMTPVFIESAYGGISQYISEYATQNSVDLIVIGAQGHSALRSFILGSVTETLVDTCRTTSILIVR